MNAAQRIFDAIKHRGEYPHQRARRRWLAVLAEGEPVMQARPVVRRVDVQCRCGHVYTEHLVVSAAQAACTMACTCIMFRPEKVVVSG